MRRPSWFVSVAVATLLSHAVLSGVRTLISYRVLALGGDGVDVGVITAVFAILPLVVALRIGRAVDRGLAVPALRLGLGLTVVAVLLAAMSSNLAILGVASATLGLAQMLHTVACQSMVALWSPPDRMDGRFGHLTLSVSAGQLLGFPIAGLVATLTTHGSGVVSTGPALFVMGAIAAAAVPLAFVFAPGDTKRVSQSDAVDGQQSTFRLLATPGMKPAMYSSLTVLTAMDLLMAYLPVLGQTMGLSVATVTALLTGRTVTSVISRAAMPILLRRIPRRWLLVSATLVSGVPMALIPFTSAVVPLMLAMLLMGFFWGVGQPLTMSWVTLIADSRNRAAALSVRLAGNRIGQVTVPIAAGALSGLIGVGAIFHASGLLLISSGLLTLTATVNMRPDSG
ncbi:MFS transporter [Gordonia jinghuaiqii]|uniref:MFS transporter n=1 Tax=Gordonia jinghuaiqii TaxID=2758710 RepID=A0A7D7QZP3_9ACTN|nr:MFS transporter [Gordonia jinghuaiqii]QMS99646.1 MFS transporter [Gordonia jinghuaiqii]